MEGFSLRGHLLFWPRELVVVTRRIAWRVRNVTNGATKVSPALKEGICDGEADEVGYVDGAGAVSASGMQRLLFNRFHLQINCLGRLLKDLSNEQPKTNQCQCQNHTWSQVNNILYLHYEHIKCGALQSASGLGLSAGHSPLPCRALDGCLHRRVFSAC